MKKLEVPNVTKELEDLYKRVDEKIAKHGKLTNDEINEVNPRLQNKEDYSLCEGR